MRRLSFLLLLLAAAPLWARDNTTWIEVRSPHFTVVTDAGEKQGRHILDQFEHMRLVFQVLFPKMNVDPAAPIMVMAVRNQKEFRELEPAAYLAKGQLNLAGYFLREPDKNDVLLRLDVEGEHPYATVYHEYTHLEIGEATEWLPLWLNEGLAEFFQNTEFDGNTARLGEPSRDDLLFLQQNRLIPLETLFRVDANSPYYHEEQKGTVFYAESWALTHYLETTDVMQHTDRVARYAQMVGEHEDPVVAAEAAFGDLKKLQVILDGYTSRGAYTYFKLNTPPMNENAVTAEPITTPQADAIRADFLASLGRTADARVLLATVLQEDPNNVLAHETMGFLAFREGKHDEAKKWYAQAVTLDSRSYLAHYYFATLSMMDGTTGNEVESSLKTAIQLNPRFAPAYDRLAMLYGMRHEELDAAHGFSLQAISLEPENVNYRLNAAHILVEQNKYDDAVRVLEAAAKVARSPLEADVVQRVLAQVQQQQAQMAEWKRQSTQDQAAAVAPEQTVVKILSGNGSEPGNAESALPKPQHPTETPHGRMLVLRGVIRNVVCSYPAVITLRVEGVTRKLSLFNNNYYKIDYSAANFTPKGEVHPCQDLEGMKAEVEYFATADKTVDGQIVAIMMIR